MENNVDLKEAQQQLERAQGQVEELQKMLEEEKERSLVQAQQLREELRGVHDQHHHKILQLDLEHKVEGEGRARCLCCSRFLVLSFLAKAD